MIVVVLAGLAILLALAAWAWRAHARTLDARTALAAARRHETRPELWPHVYVGPTTPSGLVHGTLCRVRRRNQGNAVHVVDVNGSAWICPERHVAKRPASVADVERARA